ncbi:hypothetical protein HYW76_02290 [Candidatus Pacearchaeota archaeon]|nr:hypothetical protein [Candidatus Pacearchaeota archaeon]
MVKCNKCNKELTIKLASKVKCKDCKLLGSMTTILTVYCNNCKHIFQIPISSKEILNIQEE